MQDDLDQVIGGGAVQIAVQRQRRPAAEQRRAADLVARLLDPPVVESAVVESPVAEFLKAGGACKCLTMFMPQRENASG